MSIINRPLIIPENVQVIIKEQAIEIIGSRGKLMHKIPPQIKIIKEEDKIFTKIVESAERTSVVRKNRALAGTLNSLIYNALKGVKNGHSKSMIVKGVGYKVLPKDKELEFTLGFSHSVKLAIPNNLEVTCPDNSQVIIQGANKEEVGQFAAQIRKLRKHRPYKLKGIYHKDEKIKLKAGKTLNK